MVAEFAATAEKSESTEGVTPKFLDAELQIKKTEDDVRLTFPGGHTVCASKDILIKRAAFFAPLADECGLVSYGNAELETIISALAPGSREILPSFIELLGKPDPLACDQLFIGDGLFHVFAVAHILGADEVLAIAARQWAANGGGQRQKAAIAALDVNRDFIALEACARHGLDSLSSAKLLHVAAMADAVDAARILASADDVMPEVDVRDGEGRSALHLCAVHDSALVAAVLLNASASIDALCDPPLAGDDDSGALDGSRRESTAEPTVRASHGIRTALHLAALHDSPEVAQLLLDARADVAACVKNVEGAVTPLHECAASDAARVARVLALVGSSANASAESMPIVEKGPAAEEVGVSEQGVTTGCPTPSEARNVVGDVTEGSAADGDMEVSWSRFMDPLNAKVGQISSTPLHIAAENDASGVICALVEARADIQASDDQGDTPLHCAVLYGSPRALAELLARGADALKENGTGELPIHLLAEFGPGDVGAELTPVLARRHFARSFKTQEVLVDALRERGQLSTALAHMASGDVGNTSLHSVARFDHQGAEHAVQLLLDSRAAIEAKNTEGRTPLALAARRHGINSRVAELLKKSGAEVPPPEVVDPLAGALGGCVRPLISVFKGGSVADFAAAVGGTSTPLLSLDSSGNLSGSQADVGSGNLSSPVLPILSQGLQ